MSFRRPRSSRASDGFAEVSTSSADKAGMDFSGQPGVSKAPGPPSSEAAVPADVSMESILEKLKLLDYEAEFCQRKHSRMKLLTRGYFALPVSINGQNEQFFYFTSLVAWLLTLAGRHFEAPQQFDDPNITCTAILSELREMGLAAPTCPPTKLRQGYGDAVCSVLSSLLDAVLAKRHWTWKAPVHQQETHTEEAEVDDDAEVTTNEIVDETRAGYSSDEEAYLGGSAGPAGTAGRPEHTREHAASSSSQNKVDPAEWQLEVERVGPKLKSSLSADAKDWRTHLEQAHQHSKAIAQLWPDGEAMLGRVRTEAATALDKLATRERFLNSQLESLTLDYREAHEQLAKLQADYHQKQNSLAMMDNELAHITKGLEEAKLELEERGSNISDTSPVSRIKAAITALKAELQQMLVQIGVLQHQLLQISLADSQPYKSQALAT
ncbi:hypothetical protein WJX72_011163 [[Myrmecia] bisecta]|uniref:Intraflagellar transport protein 57 homolog n=1 Tax=[Myrmecia] bisecta TaxID=41462 RepID=A0AAW1QSU4_9CHLO